jgi:hypothetical protein
MNVAMVLMALPDLDRLRELLKRIQEILTLGGIALALGCSFVFLLAWVGSYLRQPKQHDRKILSNAAILSAYLPVMLTLVAGLGALVPALAPYVLKAFALAVLSAAFSWCIAIAMIVAGGTKQNLAKARRALLLAGTPWYCLALYLSTFL